MTLDEDLDYVGCTPERLCSVIPLHWVLGRVGLRYS